MSLSSIIQRAFAAGELAPVLHSRADTVRYTQGLKQCLNFVVRREGGLENRAGLRFVTACATDTFGTRIVRFVGSEPGDSYLLEFGAGYIRFVQNGGVVEIDSADAYDGGTTYVPGDVVDSGGAFYYCIAETVGNAPPNGTFWYEMTGGVLEIPTPYTLETLPQWNQSGNVMTLTHPAHAPMELIYGGAGNWVLREVTTDPQGEVPQNVSGTPATAGSRTFAYIVTAAAAGSYEESLASAIEIVAATVAPTEDDSIDLTWDAPTDAGSVAEYYVYCDPYENGVFGYIGTAATNAFKHHGETPDFNVTPPIQRTLFDDAGEFPSCSANYQQRRFFANSLDEPDSIYGSRIGFPSNYGISSPLQDDDSITFRLAGNNHHAIRHMVAIGAGLVLLTDGGEWTVTGGGGPKNPITPSSIDAEQETYVGIDPWVRPAVIGNSVIYVQSRGAILRDLNFKEEVQGLAGRDLSIWSSHLFARKRIHSLDYQQADHSIVWVTDSDGRLLGLTYVPDQDVWGWHRHITDGAFEDVCVVPEDDEDVVYVIVRRTIMGIAKRYIERLERRDLLDGFINATMFFVDSGLSYSGGAASTFAGLDHLNGEYVAVIADGALVHDGDPATSPQVSGGTVTLGAAYTNVHIGLPYTSRLETLDMDADGTEFRDEKKRINAVSILVDRSIRYFRAGPTLADMRAYEPNAWESQSGLQTDLLELVVAAHYNKPGRMIVETTGRPLTVLGIIPRAELGG